jgi:hypothetical protein
VRTPPLLQAHAAAMPREKGLPPYGDPSRGFSTRLAAERPPSLREVITRWLNEEL